MSLQNAVSDTCMFFFGLCLGMSLHYLVETCASYCDPTRRYELFTLGLVQILINALLIQYVRRSIPNIGLFTLGLLTMQTLVIKTAIKNDL